MPHKVWEGPSRIDGRRIVCLLTGLERRSDNPKTGPMLQTWILRADVPPVEAALSGEDRSICGDCPLRSNGCYVNVAWGPNAAWKAWRSGGDLGYPDVEGKVVRLGAYGDPAAVPLRIWHGLLRKASGWTGYTHQWRRFRSMRQLCMASVDTEEEREEARRLGFRTFRIRTGGLLDGEIVCPASKEAGARTTCEKCRLCCGAWKGAKDIAILPHGPLGRRKRWEGN